MKAYNWYIWIFLIAIIGMTFSGCTGPNRQSGPYHQGPRGPLSSSGSSQWSSSSSSGTSHCPWGGCPYAFREEVESKYVQQSMDRLLEEAAQGSGSHLAALAQLEGCSLEEVPSFSYLIKNNLPGLLENTNSPDSAIQPHQLLSRMEQLLKENQAKGGICHR